MPGRRSALVRRGRDELFSAAQHQAVSPAGWAGRECEEGGWRQEGQGVSAMFSQDFFLAIILQDNSPGEGQHGAGCDVGRG